ncbi:hypothetical protein Sango_1276700 [Sesamum angolense]|uniref:Uncharacterized protein n=1 Tax=Sesamum angolense TaxID=2727404 RepID=A0AAE2BU90_9LAMI|nr:hypothetical protein Sango_1276700 [Sesamum angolense]
MNWAQRMVFYATRPSYFTSSHEGVPDDGTRSCLVDAGTSSYVYGGGGLYDYNESGLADRFSNIVHAANQLLWNGCTQSQLGVVAELVDIKADGHISEQLYDKISQWSNRILPSDHTLSGDYYSTKKLKESRNVCLGLCTDDFVSHDQYDRTYSCWSVIITLYNLPPSMCMSFEHIFFTMVIPDPSNPKRLIDVYLEPLIEKLLQLWHVGVRTYDHATDRAFMMRVTLMWTVKDLPAYGMVSGWSTAEVIGCPICMDNTKAFHLQYGDQILNRVANISPAIEIPLSLPDGYGSDHK